MDFGVVLPITWFSIVFQFQSGSRGFAEVDDGTPGVGAAECLALELESDAAAEVGAAARLRPGVDDPACLLLEEDEDMMDHSDVDVQYTCTVRGSEGVE